MTLADRLAQALDPVEFARACGFEPDGWQADALRSPSPRLALNCSRQSGKSQVAATRTVWTAVHRPGSTVVLIAPAMRQSVEMFRRVLAMYEAIGRPVVAEQENLSSMTLENGSRVLSLPGDPATVRGIAAVSLLVIDEAARVGDDLWTAVSPMVAVSGGQVLAISTPWGRRGWWYRACTDRSQGWEVVTVAAAQCPRITPQFLEQQRASMTPLDYASEYEVQFVEGAGSLFDLVDVDRAFTPGEPFDPSRPLRALRLEAADVPA